MQSPLWNSIVILFFSLSCFFSIALMSRVTFDLHRFMPQSWEQVSGEPNERLSGSGLALAQQSNFPQYEEHDISLPSHPSSSHFTQPVSTSFPFDHIENPGQFQAHTRVPGQLTKVMLRCCDQLQGTPLSSFDEIPMIPSQMQMTERSESPSAIAKSW